MIGKGKIEIAIPKTSFNPGEIISGIATLMLKKTTKARRLSISFIGDQKITEHRGTSTSTKNIRIYEFEQHLDGKKEYTEGAYPFEIKIPADILEQEKKPQIPQPGGKVGAVLTIARTLAGIEITKRTSWYLIARLDIPWGTDITEKVQITIG